LLHCLLRHSPPDTPEEIAALARNQHRTSARGREPGLMLERGGAEVMLTRWGADIVAQCAPIADALDAAHGHKLHSEALASASAALANPDLLPSARVLAAMAQGFDNSFAKFVSMQSEKTRDSFNSLPFSKEQQAHFAALSQRSLEEQKKIEAADSLAFEVYRQQYVAVERLGMPKRQMAAV